MVFPLQSPVATSFTRSLRSADLAIQRGISTIQNAFPYSRKGTKPLPKPSPIFVRFVGVRSHYSYSGPGKFGEDGADGSSDSHSHSHASCTRSDWGQRGYTVGIGGPVGSGKTALVLKLTQALKGSSAPVGVVTNDIFTQEDAEFLVRNDALPSNLIRAVETGGCPHAAIREDVSANLSACEELTYELRDSQDPALILCESGGDNLAANFSHELADLTLYVIDVAGGDKVPRKGGPGITQSDLLIVNKIDLAEAVGADLDVMKRDADMMRRRQSKHGGNYAASGPTQFAAIKHGTGVPEIRDFILKHYQDATGSMKE